MAAVTSRSSLSKSKDSKYFTNQSFFLPIRSVAFRTMNFTCSSTKRQFTSLSSGKEVLFKSRRNFRSAFLALGTAVSLACVLVLKQQKEKVNCEEQVHEKVNVDDAKPTFSSLLATKTRLLAPNSLKVAIDEAHVFLQQVREETGAPGLVVAVSVDGKLVWSEGLGYADVENNVKCTPKTVMRIASISKPLTATAVAKLYEQNKLDIDAPIQKYVPTFPLKFYKGEEVTITTRQLLSHLGGIRHYDQNILPKEGGNNATVKKKENAATTQEEDNSEKTAKSGEPRKKNEDDFKNKEYYIKDPKTIKESLALFQDDLLVGEPGESYLYTTHGWTLISAVVESAAQEDFLSYMKNLFRELGMNHTAPEFNDPIIYNRARFYQRDEKHGLVNAPYIDNSYKWAGGGFVSTVADLVKFGNAMLYSSQVSQDDHMLPGILKPETIKEMWKEVEKNKEKADKDGWYGWGWYVIPDKQSQGACRHVHETIFHTGSAIGAVSVLLIRPENQPNTTYSPPRGIVVSVIMNLQETSKSISGTAKQVADIFEDNLEFVS